LKTPIRGIGVFPHGGLTSPEQPSVLYRTIMRYLLAKQAAYYRFHNGGRGIVSLSTIFN